VEGGPVSGKAAKAHNLAVVIFPEILNRCKRFLLHKTRADAMPGPRRKDQIAQSVTFSMGWSLPYTLGVLGRWKMAPVYCQAVLCYSAAGMRRR
jgi:hypothetical protein